MNNNRSNILIFPEDVINLEMSSGDWKIPAQSLNRELSSNQPDESENDRLNEVQPDEQNQVIQHGERSVEPILIPPPHFQNNKELMQLLANNYFPPRNPKDATQSEHMAKATETVKPETERETDEINTTESEAVTDESVIQYVGSSKKQRTNYVIELWNNFVKMMNPSKTGYDLNEYETVCAKFMIDDAISLINSNLQKPYCGKYRYQNVGSAFFPTKNQFYKIQKRSLAKLDAAKLVEYYMDEKNQCIMIPFEFTSRLSRSFSCSYELTQLTGACNKIQTPLNFNSNIEDLKHPLSTMGYKASIEEEMMPVSSFCLMYNFSKISEVVPDTYFRNKHIQNNLYNYPYISHIFHRSEFWIDDLYVKMWHYARSFCDEVRFSNRAIPEFVLITKDTVFRHLLKCSVNICTYIKKWVINEDMSTYFRCWCGQRVYDKITETQLINRLGIGSCKLMNTQLNILNKKFCHKKHARESLKFHMCQCGGEFETHEQWMKHTFSTKIYDVSKACPIVLFNFMKLSLLSENHKFQCECDAEFGDYDFWQFWLHLCNCKTMKKVVNASCMCCHKYQTKTLKRAYSRAGNTCANKKQKTKNYENL